MSLKMSKNIHLIPAKDAMIIWKPKKHQEDFDLKVYYRNGPCVPEHYQDSRIWPCSSGCAYTYWAKMTPSQMFAACIKIILSEGVSNKSKVKLSLFEFGKIQELEEMRMMYHALYYETQIPYEGLLPSFYGWDFCDGK